MRMEAAGLRATGDDSLSVSVSRDAGLHWRPVWNAEGTGPQTMRLALRDEVAGVTQCLIKVEMRAAQSKSNVGLDSFRVVTITQLDRLTLPKLTLGANEVLLRADEQVETTELWPVLHAGAYRQTAVEEDNVFSDKQPDGMYKATLGAGVNGRECSVTWRLAVPTDITAVTYGVISTNRSPQSWVSLRRSWDGSSFEQFHLNNDGDFPFDEQVLQSFGDAPAGTRQAYFRGVFFCKNGAATYNMPGIQDLLLRVCHQPRDATFQPIEVTYHWTEHRDGRRRRPLAHRTGPLPAPPLHDQRRGPARPDDALGADEPAGLWPRRQSRASLATRTAQTLGRAGSAESHVPLGQESRAGQTLYGQSKLERTVRQSRQRRPRADQRHRDRPDGLHAGQDRPGRDGLLGRRRAGHLHCRSGESDPDCRRASEHPSAQCPACAIQPPSRSLSRRMAGNGSPPAPSGTMTCGTRPATTSLGSTTTVRLTRACPPAVAWPTHSRSSSPGRSPAVTCASSARRSTAKAWESRNSRFSSESMSHPGPPTSGCRMRLPIGTRNHEIVKTVVRAVRVGRKCGARCQRCFESGVGKGNDVCVLSRFAKTRSTSERRATSGTCSVCRQGDDPHWSKKTFSVAGKESRGSMNLPAMEDGTYELRVALGGEPPTTTRKYFKHKNFAWLGNTLGKSETIYPPFEPIRVKDRDGGCAADVPKMASGLWDSVKSEGKEILAQPMVLRVQTEDGEQQWQFGDSGWTTVQPHRGGVRDPGNCPGSPGAHAVLRRIRRVHEGGDGPLAGCERARPCSGSGWKSRSRTKRPRCSTMQPLKACAAIMRARPRAAEESPG